MLYLELFKTNQKCDYSQIAQRILMHYFTKQSGQEFPSVQKQIKSAIIVLIKSNQNCDQQIFSKHKLEQYKCAIQNKLNYRVVFFQNEVQVIQICYSIESQRVINLEIKIMQKRKHCDTQNKLKSNQCIISKQSKNI
ncbi:hypothetical protein ABPG72_018360 [Tetrahymena utriculariae]